MARHAPSAPHVAARRHPRLTVITPSATYTVEDNGTTCRALKRGFLRTRTYTRSARGWIADHTGAIAQGRDHRILTRLHADLLEPTS